ncbi:MAG: Cytochrome C, partial [Gammaproteobacteria bacterium]|nr:Cytochrome C [Gammaproteobacteria bacterium]
NQDDFRAHAQTLLEKATAFSTAAQSGDQAVTLKELRPLGTACGDCHDNYRMDEN